MVIEGDLVLFIGDFFLGGKIRLVKPLTVKKGYFTSILTKKIFQVYFNSIISSLLIYLKYKSYQNQRIYFAF